MKPLKQVVDKIQPSFSLSWQTYLPKSSPTAASTTTRKGAEHRRTLEPPDPANRNFTGLPSAPERLTVRWKTARRSLFHSDRASSTKHTPPSPTKTGNPTEMSKEAAMEASSLHLRHRPPEEQQQKKTNPGRTVDTGKPNPNLQSLLVASGIYTGRPIRGSLNLRCRQGHRRRRGSGGFDAGSEIARDSPSFFFLIPQFALLEL